MLASTVAITATAAAATGSDTTDRGMTAEVSLTPVTGHRIVELRPDHAGCSSSAGQSVFRGIHRRLDKRVIDNEENVLT